MPGIDCGQMKCEDCPFEWRNAQYNSDCFLQEFRDFVMKLVEKK